jgi:hypothetical protein
MLHQWRPDLAQGRTPRRFHWVFALRIRVWLVRAFLPSRFIKIGTSHNRVTTTLTTTLTQPLVAIAAIVTSLCRFSSST